ncbi:MAG TPA: hypothetical protein VGM98_08950, partial [Schlesneria sp.]
MELMTFDHQTIAAFRGGNGLHIFSQPLIQQRRLDDDRPGEACRRSFGPLVQVNTNGRACQVSKKGLAK